MSRQEFLDKQQTKESNSFLFGLFVNYMKPSAYVESVLDINLQKLKDQGIKMIICDLDNTLVPHFTKFPTKMAFEFSKKVREAEMEFVIVSTNTNRRVSFFAEKLNTNEYIANAKKPFKKKISKLIKDKNLETHEVAIVGDMIITDVLVANFIKCESILVNPVIQAEKTLSKVMSWVEEKIFKRLSNENLIVKETIVEETLLSEEYEIL